MKRKILAGLLAIGMALALTACDENQRENVDIDTHYYVNTTETLDVSTYNGYRFGRYNIEPTDEGGYTVTIEVMPPQNASAK